MTLRLPLPLLLALASLAACASPIAYDAANDTRQWIYDVEGSPLKLAYGTPQSDDVALMMTCRAASGRVTLSQGGLKPGQGVVLASEGRSVTLHGSTEDDQLNGGLVMEVEAGADHPVLQGFRDKGELRLFEGDHLVPMHATPAERAQIQQFFARCSR